MNEGSSSQADGGDRFASGGSRVLTFKVFDLAKLSVFSFQDLKTAWLRSVFDGELNKTKLDSLG